MKSVFASVVRTLQKNADVSGSELAPNTAGKSKGEIADEHARERGLQAVKTSPSIQRKLAAEDEGSPILRGPVGAGIGILSGALSKSSSLEKEALDIPGYEAAKARIQEIEGMLKETGKGSVRSTPLVSEMNRLRSRVEKHEPRLRMKHPDYFNVEAHPQPSVAPRPPKPEPPKFRFSRPRVEKPPPFGFAPAEDAFRNEMKAEARAAETAGSVGAVGAGAKGGFLGRVGKVVKHPGFFLPAAAALGAGGYMLADRAKRRQQEMGLPKAAAAIIKKAQMLKTGNFADPVNRRYPLDSLEDVIEANQYMDKYASEFDPRTRRSVATAIYKRSELLGIPTSKSVREIVIRKVASVDVVRGHLEAREVYYGRDSEAGKVCELLKTKVASTHPEVLAEAIAVMDAKYGGDKVWGSWLPEPWDCVFQKTAQDETKDVSTYAYDAGRFHISGIDLVRLAKRSPEVDRRFGKEFAEQFRADPIQFFDHLPLPEKQVLSQMAHDHDGSGAPLPIQRG
jgi:hypothetical protein